MRSTTRLRKLFEAGRTIVAPGIADGLSARLVAQAGFEAVYASGGAISRSTGIPDLGLLSSTEIVARLESIVDVVELPVIADADTGYGNALNARRAVRAFERAGVAALHLEDQTFPKKCGHYDDKSLVPVTEMVQKLKAARDALHGAAAYVEAGADMVFVEAPTTEEQIAEIARRVPGWKLINMFQGGKTPLLPTRRLAELGYQLVIIPSDLQRAAIAAMRRALRCIADDGSTAAMAGDMVTFKEREALIGTEQYQELDRRFGA
jgi:2-methylisocitrate lyase-like PEP mutase family enzyme